MKTINPRGTPTNLIVTSQDFSDHFGAPDGEARANSGSNELNNTGQYSYAFPTSVTNALGHMAYGQFDYYFGRPVNGENPNGIVSSGFYTNAAEIAGVADAVADVDGGPFLSKVANLRH